MQQSQTSRLAELRAKTDREVYALIRSRLEAGSAHARQAETDRRAGDWAAAEESDRRAQAAMDEAHALLRIMNRDVTVRFVPGLACTRTACRAGS